MNDKVYSYKDLHVWQKAIKLCVLVYKVSEKYPRSELFGLVSQMRRASVSIPSNIAEGCGRFQVNKEYVHFLRISYGSAQELETQLIISKELKYLNEEDAKEMAELLIDIEKMLNKMISNINIR